MNKKMKRLYCLCLAMILVLGLVACGSKKEKVEEPKKKVTDEADKEKKEDKPQPYAKGKVEGNHFESEWLNMQADFSDQYVMASEEEMAQMQSAGSEVLLGEDGQEVVDQAQEEGKMVNEMMVLAPTGNPNCTVAVEKLPLKNFTAKQYLEATKQNLLNSITDELKIAMRGAMPIVEIAGEEFMCLRADMNMQGTRMSSNTYVRIKDGYAIVINATYNNDTEAQKDELLAVFKPMK